MLDKIFYTTCFGFISGVLLRTFIFIDFYIVILFFIISFFLILFFSLISKNKWLFIFSIFLLFFSLGILRFDNVDKSLPEFFETQLGEKVSLSGEIIDQPDIRENNQKLVVMVEIQRTVLKGAQRTVLKKEETSILITTDFNQDFKYGDIINFSGELSKPENFITDQGKEFDYINYLKKDGILYMVGYPTIEIISSGNGFWLKSFLFSIKDKFVEKINLLIPSPENLLMNGLILGEKSAFDAELRQSFVNTGTIHIIALSGYNVTIVAEWIMKLFIFLPVNLGIYIGILAILLFILMTGGSSTMLVFQKHIAGKTKASICCIGCKI